MLNKYDIKDRSGWWEWEWTDTQLIILIHKSVAQDLTLVSQSIDSIKKYFEGDQKFKNCSPASSIDGEDFENHLVPISNLGIDVNVSKVKKLVTVRFHAFIQKI